MGQAWNTRLNNLNIRNGHAVNKPIIIVPAMSVVRTNQERHCHHQRTNHRAALRAGGKSPPSQPEPAAGWRQHQSGEISISHLNIYCNIKYLRIDISCIHAFMNMKINEVNIS